MTFLVVANFKSNLLANEVTNWISQVKPTPQIVVAPSALHLSLFSGKDFVLAGQDVSPFPPGSYTGAINANQLKEQGVSYCVVGHSERRRYFHETSTDVAKKVSELVSLGITPIICMEEGDITSQFAALDQEFYPHCLYCFEPAGDIGGLVTATSSEIEAIKQKVLHFYEEAKFMYGGSVNSGNISSLLPLGLAGVLVASASLDPTSYQKIIEQVNHAD